MKNNKSHQVKDDYNKISAQFASTRHYEWPEMKKFSSYVKDGWKILDLGCGNGRLLQSFGGKKIDYLGIDNSDELVEIAKKNHPKKNFQIMNMENLNLKDGTFDGVFAIASLHHLSRREMRLRALLEANRILKKDGYLFVTVWNLWQPKYRKYIWKNLFNMVLKKSKTHFGDTFIPWKDSKQNILVERYYFAYTKNGLKKDLGSSGFEIIEIAHSKWNIYAICKKVEF